jgi:hypothetical protein
MTTYICLCVAACVVSGSAAAQSSAKAAEDVESVSWTRLSEPQQRAVYEQVCGSLVALPDGRVVYEAAVMQGYASHLEAGENGRRSLQEVQGHRQSQGDSQRPD